MTLGRPSAIPESYIKLDLPRDYGDMVSAPGHVPAPSSAKEPLWFFNGTMYVLVALRKVVKVFLIQTQHLVSHHV